jgi:hypothetical protein
VQGERAQEYVNISRPIDAAMGQIGQIPQGRQNGIHLEAKCACKGNQPAPRAFRPDMFAILAPRRRW